MSGWRPEFPEFIEKQREAERQKERQGQEVQRLEQQSNLQAWSNTQASYDWFARLFDKRLDQHIERDRPEVIAAFAEFVVERERKVCNAYDAKLATLEAEIKTMKQQASFAQQFADLARDLDARQIARDEAKRASEIIPQGEVLAEIEKLQRQLDDLKGVANLEARVGELEKTNSLEARFTKLVNEAKGAEVPELLAKIERLQHQIDDLNKVAAQSGPQGPPGPPGKLPRVKERVSRNMTLSPFITKPTSSCMPARCGKRALISCMRRRTPIGSASLVRVAMVAMGGRLMSAAHTMRVKSTSGSTSLRSMVAPSSLDVTILASVPAMAGNC